MDNITQAIQNAISADADDATRTEGVRACRAVLAALEAKTGEPLAPSPGTTPLETVVAGLRGVPVEQLLDLAIAKLKSALPAGVEAAPVQPLSFRLLPVPGRTK